MTLGSAAVLPVSALSDASDQADAQYQSPLKQRDAGVALYNIQCNEPRNLYVTDSNMPVCLFLDTYQILLDRGVLLSALLPPTEPTPASVVRDVITEIISMYDSDPDGTFEGITAMMSADPSYPFVADSDGIILAHGSNPSLVGEDLLPLIQFDGTIDEFVSEFEDDEMWTVYMFGNPATGTEQYKHSLLVWHDGHIFGSGYYVDPEQVVRSVIAEALAMYDSDPDNAFVNISTMISTDPYPFVVNATGTVLAIGSNHYLLGNDNSALPIFLDELQDGELWIEYTFPNPTTGTTQHKRTLLILHDGYIFGAGYYTSPESIIREVIADAITLYDADPDGAFEKITANLTDLSLPFVLDPDSTFLSSTNLPVPVLDWEYPFVIDSKGFIVAHGTHPGSIGKESILSESAGMPIDVLVSELQNRDIWIEYVFHDPATRTDQHKRSLLILHDGYIFGSGYYPPPESIVVGVVAETIALYDSDPDGAFETVTAMMSTEPSYPFVFDSNGTIIAHGSNPALIGQDGLPLIQFDGTVDELVSGFDDKGEMWIEYTFYNPSTMTDQHKRTLLTLHDGYIFGSGHYTNPELIVRGVIAETIALYDSDPDGAFETVTAMMSTEPSYPFVINQNGTISAHASDPDLIGNDSVLVASTGKSIDMIISDLQDKGEMWIEYTFYNPATMTDQHKRTLIILHDGYIFASGYYIPLEDSPS